MELIFLVAVLTTVKERKALKGTSHIFQIEVHDNGACQVESSGGHWYTGTSEGMVE